MGSVWLTAGHWLGGSRSVRIALLHSFYTAAVSSGENTVVEAQVEALARAGHDVVLIGRHTDLDQQHLSMYPVRAAWRTLTSHGPDPTPLLERFQPDVVHIHNTVPNIGLQWLSKWDGPIVHTLHNYRPLCANGLLFRDGHFCTLCPDGQPWAAVEHGCYRGSRVYSLPIAARNSRGIEANPLLRRSDALIVLSQPAREIYLNYGLPAPKLRLVPNGVPSVHATAAPPPQAQRWLAVGRLSAEKGFDVMLRSWPAEQPLDIIGEGPQRDELLGVAPHGVRFLGPMPVAEVREAMSGYSGLLFPGLAVESALPLVVGEALEAGLPVLFGAGHRQAGALVAAGVAREVRWDAPADEPEGLATAMAWVDDGGQTLRRAARAWYEAHLTEEVWLERLMQVYRGVQVGS